MRKKKEIPSAKRGRPRHSGLIIPTWAGKAIQGLSDHSGVTPQRILEVALRDGIQLVGEPLGAWAKYQQSSEKLWNEHVENPQKANSQEPALEAIEPASGPSGDLDDDLGFERREPIEVSEDNEVIQSLNGE